jgi:exportin-T
LNSIVHYTVVQGKVLDQKAGYNLLTRMVTTWMPAAAGAGANGNASADAIPGFEQFCYQEALKGCFEIPMRDGFDYGDAQSYNVRLL